MGKSPNLGKSARDNTSNTVTSKSFGKLYYVSLGSYTGESCTRDLEMSVDHYLGSEIAVLFHFTYASNTTWLGMRRLVLRGFGIDVLAKDDTLEGFSY